MKAELNATREAHQKALAAAVESHQGEAAKLIEERDNALKASEESMALPRIRPVMVPPPSLQQTAAGRLSREYFSSPASSARDQPLFLPADHPNE